MDGIILELTTESPPSSSLSAYLSSSSSRLIRINFNFTIEVVYAIFISIFLGYLSSVKCIDIPVKGHEGP
jgi:hypothetical protein